MPVVRPVDLSNPLRCHKPWEGRETHGTSRGMPECCTYRGWTLVNVASGWRVAVHGAERVKVCKAGTDHNVALHEFRAKVDAFEDAR